MPQAVSKLRKKFFLAKRTKINRAENTRDEIRINIYSREFKWKIKVKLNKKIKFLTDKMEWFKHF